MGQAAKRSAVLGILVTTVRRDVSARMVNHVIRNEGRVTVPQGGPERCAINPAHLTDGVSTAPRTVRVRSRPRFVTDLQGTVFACQDITESKFKDFFSKDAYTCCYSP